MTDLWTRLAKKYDLPRDRVKSACWMYLYMGNISYAEAVKMIEARLGNGLAELLRNWDADVKYDMMEQARDEQLSREDVG